LVDALRLLDPDTKTDITEVSASDPDYVFGGGGRRALSLTNYEERDALVAELRAQIEDLMKEVDDDGEKDELETDLEKAYSEIERLTEELEALKGGKG
jgi:hypothetical protein